MLEMAITDEQLQCREQEGMVYKSMASFPHTQPKDQDTRNVAIEEGDKLTIYRWNSRGA